ncbi:MAG: alpha/beta hydrolase [Fimbriimonadaceae bacterium]|nr:alpha/beta hydrolase [Fimbriimonadaceae bacterium]
MRIKTTLAALVALCALPISAQAAEGTFDSNGVKIRYVTEGQGEAIVLIHGWMSDSSMWGRDAATGETKLTPLEGFQAIALDCRGHGKSDKPYEPSKYGAEMAEDVVRLLDHLKIKRAHLIGYSMGAFIAGHVAATHPDRVISVVYGGQAPLIKEVSSLKFGEVDLFAKAVEEGDLGSYIMAVSPDDKPKPTKEQADAYAKFLYGKKDVRAFVAAGRGFKDLAVSVDDLKKCKAPTLFIYGGNESDYVKNCVSAARKVVPNHEVKIVEGADHMTTLTKPDFGAALVGFLMANKGK